MKTDEARNKECCIVICFLFFFFIVCRVKEEGGGISVFAGYLEETKGRRHGRT